MNSLFKTVTASQNALSDVLKRTPSKDVLTFNAPIISNQAIHIHDLEIQMFVGVMEVEKQQKQRVILNLDIEVAPNENWQKDDINEAVSYADIIDLIQSQASKQHFELVETFANTIADACLKSDSRIKSLSIEMSKPDIISQAGSVGCTIKKSRANL